MSSCSARSTVAAALLLLALAGGSASAQDIAVRAGVLHTGAGESFAPGVVVIRGGKIIAVGAADAVAIPAGMEVLEAPVATPGLIDARSVVGLAGAMNQAHDQDQLERSAAIQPELRAVDAYNPRELLVDWLREHGVTTLHTGHGPGEVISGQTLIAKTAGGTVDEAVIRPVFALAATLGEQAAIGHARSSPGNRSKAVAMLREQLVKAGEYRVKRSGKDESKRPPRDLALEALAQVLDGELPLVIEVHRHSDIMTALRLAKEFEFRLILSGASDAHLLIDEIRTAGVPVLLHPTMMRARGPEVENFSFTTAARLLEAGIPVALQGGYEGYVPKGRVVLFEAAMTLPYGLDFDQALSLVTSAPARILGIDDRVGTLEVGKDGDVALFGGDPFEYTTQVIGTVIDGRRVSSTLR
ncbi:MAG TPA: amidohydrolase family protein [Gammaproteobacteria bacterium]|nr:amidohydrolase family protein [Gammaproteobacteria bacterium]HRP86851.1 amidohydrolase family protein [Gammaproteobacteria bacterium]